MSKIVRAPDHSQPVEVGKAAAELIAKHYKIPKKCIEVRIDNDSAARSSDNVTRATITIFAQKSGWAFPCMFKFTWPFRSAEEDFLSPTYQGAPPSLAKVPLGKMAMMNDVATNKKAKKVKKEVP